MSKKTKIIIISVVVAIVLILAIVLGVVFGTKDKPAPDDSTDTQTETDVEETAPVWGDWTITAPTADAVGKAVRTNDKGESESVELPILSSDKYTTEVVTAATYDAAGKTKYSITINGVTHSFEIATSSLDGEATVYINGVKLDTTLKHKKADTIADANIKELIGNKGFKSYIAYSDKEMNTKIEDVNAYLKDKKEATIYLDMTFTYTLDIGEGVLPTGVSKTYDTNVAIGLPEPTLEGYDFVGWYTSKDFAEGTAIEYGAKYYGVGNATLYAKFEELGSLLFTPIHEVSYDESTPIIGYSVDSNDAKKPQGDIVIPAKYKGKDVIAIKMMCFYGCDKMTSLTIPSTIKNIDDRVFESCPALETIVVEEGNTAYKVVDNCLIQIEDGKLLVATNKATSLPNDVKIIGQESMKYASVKDLVLSDNVTTIESYAFTSSKIESITIGKNVTKIGDYVFLYCRKLATVNFAPEIKISAISDSMFDGCSQLNNVTIPNSVTKIGGSAFSSCHALTTIAMSDNVTEIGNFAFSECESLTEIDLPANLTTLGEEVFRGTGLQSIHIGARVHRLTPRVFYGCPLVNITIDPYNADSQMIVKDNCLILTVNGKKTLVKAGALVENIPNEVEAIAGYAIHQSKVTRIVIPDTVTNMERCAIYNCDNLAAIYLPKSVTTIASEAFYQYHDFKIFTDAKEAEKPLGWEDGWCRNLAAENILWEASINAVDFVTNGDGTCTANAKTNTNTFKHIFIPSMYNGDVVTAIADGTFSGCNLLENVSLPDGLKTIGNNAFEGCTALKSIALPNTLETIGANAFDGCTAIKEIVIPKSVKTIGANALNNNDRLAISVEIEETAKPATWAANWYGNNDAHAIYWGFRF